MSNAVAIGFAIYNPEDSFLERVQTAIDCGCEVYILDNSPEKEKAREFSEAKAEVKYFTTGKNIGLGLGISFICAQAFYEGNSALIFFDQDTIFNHETLKFIKEYYLQHPEFESKYSAVVFNSKNKGKEINGECFKNVPLAINSGSLFYLSNLKNMKWHSEKYFVDCVDYEFCFRSRKNGLLIGEYSCTPGFDHVTEQADKEYTIFGRSYLSRAYSSSRILDASISSVKLIFKALISGDIGFSLKIAKLFFIYIASQISVRFMDATTEKRA